MRQWFPFSSQTGWQDNCFLLDWKWSVVKCHGRTESKGSILDFKASNNNYNDEYLYNAYIFHVREAIYLTFKPTVNRQKKCRSPEWLYCWCNTLLCCTHSIDYCHFYSKCPHGVCLNLMEHTASTQLNNWLFNGAFIPYHTMHYLAESTLDHFFASVATLPFMTKSVVSRRVVIRYSHLVLDSPWIPNGPRRLDSKRERERDSLKGIPM